MKCRCRLAVWRQLPKLIPASSTLVTCSNNKEVLKLESLFCFLYKKISPRVHGLYPYMIML